MAPINVLLTGLPSTSTLCLRIGTITQGLTQPALTAAVTAATGLPAPSFYLRRAGAVLFPHSLVSFAGQNTVFVEVFLRRALPGGKGGFGATLKGSSASKITTNFDACRDLHGRRLRHVRDEAAIAEYLRTHAPPLSPRDDRPRKRPRAPQPHHDDIVTKLDTEELDQSIDATNRDVEDAVAAGLRAAADQRKRQRVLHSQGPRAHVAMIDLVDDAVGMSSSDSDDSEAGAVSEERRASSLRNKQS